MQNITIHTKLTDITFKTRFICDRSDLIKAQVRKETGEQCLMYDRLDMFWIEIEGKDEYDRPKTCGALCIDPSIADPEQFTVSQNHFKGDVSDVRDEVTTWFKQQPEYKQQVEWTKALIAAGYTRFGNTRALICPVCKSRFLKLDNHKHRIYEGNIYPYDIQGHYGADVKVID